MKILLILPFLIYSSFAQDGSSYVDVIVQDFESTNEIQQNAIKFNHVDHWHTYWKNSGDSGLPTEFSYSIDGKKIVHSESQWQTPKLFKEDSDIWTYGYDGQTYFFHQIEKSKLKGAKKVSLSIKWLVCKEICIPGKKEINGTISNSKITWNSNKALAVEELKAAYNALPIPIELTDDEFHIEVKRTGEENTLDLFFKSTKFDKKKKGSNFLIPLPSKVISFRHEKIPPLKARWIEGHIPLEWIGQYNEPEIAFPKSNDLKNPLIFKFLIQDRDKSYIVTRSINKILGEATPVKKKVNNQVDTQSAPSYSLGVIILMALLGGLILNLMPCVLPVISIKLFGLIKSKKSTRPELFKHNILYSLGVISTLMLLALVIIALKHSGEQVGWGFQLQSPTFVAILCLILFIMTLNFFGLFEFITPGGSKLGNVNTQDSPLEDFLAGVLTTILSTPCSAPFLGSALAFALTSNTPTILLVFFCIGLGLASPFLLTSVFPGLLNILPKPGIWMEKFKYFLGLTLLLTLIWLLDLLHSLVDSSHLISTIYPKFAFVFFIFFSRKYISKNIFLLLTLLGITGYFGFSFYNNYSAPSIITTSINWKTWSPEINDEYINSNNTAFIDFTAKWCLTCQVNKKVVLHTDDFYDNAKEKGIDLYQADWTRKDSRITKFLEDNNLVGIPAYFLIKDGQLHFLGETITIGKLNEFFD